MGHPRRSRASEDPTSSTLDENDRYVERGLPDAWRPILEPFVEASHPADILLDGAPTLDGRRLTTLFEAFDAQHPRDAGILERRAAGDTLATLGAALDLTRERVRQIEARARTRLRDLEATQTDDGDGGGS